MATTKIYPQVRNFAKPGNPSEVCTPDLASKTNERPIATTEDIIRELVAQGVPLEKIRIPGRGKKDILFVSDDFNAPLEDFEDSL